MQYNANFTQKKEENQQYAFHQGNLLPYATVLTW